MYLLHALNVEIKTFVICRSNFLEQNIGVNHIMNYVLNFNTGHSLFLLLEMRNISLIVSRWDSGLNYFFLFIFNFF